MNVADKIKARIAQCRQRLNSQCPAGEYDDYGNGRNYGEELAIEDEIDFLVEFLVEVERERLKAEGYNV